MPHLLKAKEILQTSGCWEGEIVVGFFVKRTPVTEHAPDLLEALKSLLEMPGAIVTDAEIIEHNRRRELARAAIAKAEGR